MAKKDPHQWRKTQQLQEITSMLHTVENDEATQKAVPIVEAAHTELWEKISDLNQRHVAGTDSQGGTIGWQDARRVAGIIEKMDKKARTAANENVLKELKEVGVPENVAAEMASYLSRIIVPSERLER